MTEESNESPLSKPLTAEMAALAEKHNIQITKEYWVDEDAPLDLSPDELRLLDEISYDPPINNSLMETIRLEHFNGEHMVWLSIKSGDKEFWYEYGLHRGQELSELPEPKDSWEVKDLKTALMACVQEEAPSLLETTEIMLQVAETLII